MKKLKPMEAITKKSQVSTPVKRRNTLEVRYQQFVFNSNFFKILKLLYKLSPYFWNELTDNFRSASLPIGYHLILLDYYLFIAYLKTTILDISNQKQLKKQLANAKYGILYGKLFIPYPALLQISKRLEKLSDKKHTIIKILNENNHDLPKSHITIVLYLIAFTHLLHKNIKSLPQ